jgi:hypothetical protein
MSAVLTMEDGSTLIAPCRTCGRERYSRTLRKAITCLTCFPRELPYDPDALRRLARRERKRIRAQVAVAVTAVLSEEQLGFRRWPPELITTVRVLDRWGSFGTGLPAQNPDVYRQSLPVPLDPDTQAVATQCIGPDPMARGVVSHPCLVPPKVRFVTWEIWWRGAPMSHVGKSIGMKPRSFGRYVEDCLALHRKAFLASRHADLVALIGERP